MNQLYFTPGPSELYYTVGFHLQNAMKKKIGSISHRSSDFLHLFRETRQNLSRLLGLPEDYEILFLSSATEAWERIIQNLVTRHSHHFVNGAFSQRFFDFTSMYGLESTISTAPNGMEFTNWKVPEQTEMISVTMNETSIGYSFSELKLKQLRQENPDKIIALDVVSITPAVPVDFSLVDTAYLSVQKCFGLPAGLGVWIVNKKVLETAVLKESNGHLTGSYHSLSSLKKYADKDQTPETPNVLSLYLLNKVVADMQQKGLPMIQNETRYKSALIYQLFDSYPTLTAYVKEKENRSRTVCVAEVVGGNDLIIKHLEGKGLTIGKGYGQHKSDHIRIANFPTHSKEQVEMLVDSINDLKAWNI